MVLKIDTDHKTILFSGCDMAEAVHFARLHEFDWYVVKRDLPAYRVDYAGTFRNPEPFNPDEVFRGILGKDDASYLESEVVENPITKLFILPKPESDSIKIDLLQTENTTYTLTFNVDGQI